MLLCIDCGNTNTVFSIWDGARFLATWRIATDHKRTADEYFVWLSSLMMLTKTEAHITEAIISIPGVGRITVSAISSRDMPLLQGAVLFATVLVILGNLVADILYSILDPRIRAQMRSEAS